MSAFNIKTIIEGKQSAEFNQFQQNEYISMPGVYLSINFKIHSDRISYIRFSKTKKIEQIINNWQSKNLATNINNTIISNGRSAWSNKDILYIIKFIAEANKNVPNKSINFRITEINRFSRNVQVMYEIKELLEKYPNISFNIEVFDLYKGISVYNFKEDFDILVKEVWEGEKYSLELSNKQKKINASINKIKMIEEIENFIKCFIAYKIDHKPERVETILRENNYILENDTIKKWKRKYGYLLKYLKNGETYHYKLDREKGIYFLCPPAIIKSDILKQINIDNLPVFKDECIKFASSENYNNILNYIAYFESDKFKTRSWTNALAGIGDSSKKRRKDDSDDEMGGEGPKKAKPYSGKGKKRMREEDDSSLEKRNRSDNYNLRNM